MENSLRLMKNPGLQFWTLLLVSCAVSLLLLKQIFLSRAIIREQHVLVDSHETADSDSVYQSAWEKLALSVYKSGAQDPAMFDLLKNEGVSIHEGPPPGSTPAVPSAVPVPSASTKPVQTPPHPSAP
jgi:hypothetical protein